MKDFEKAKALFDRRMGVDPSTLDEFAIQYGLNKANVQEMADTIQNIDRNWDGAPTADYCRISMGKLLVPRGFKKHCEMLSSLLNVRIEAIFQLFLIQTLAEYSKKYGKLMDTLNEGIRNEDNARFPQKDTETRAIEIIPGITNYEDVRKKLRGDEDEGE